MITRSGQIKKSLMHYSWNAMVQKMEKNDKYLGAYLFMDSTKKSSY